MNKGLIAVAAGAFAMGFSEFIVMGTLTEIAAGIGVSVPAAGGFISAYAVGVCFGTLILVFGHAVPPKRLLMLFMLICCAGNALAAASTSAAMLTVARFVSGVPHGAFFGTATIVSRALAEKGKEGQAVGTMVLGQTLANTIGVPGGTLLASGVSWRATFIFVAVWALVSFVLVLRLVPDVSAPKSVGLAGQFRFLGRPGPWLVLGAVLLGNTGIFCWWSYVSPWLTTWAGFPEGSTPVLLVVAGLGMVLGSQLGGRAADRLTAGVAAAIGQGMSAAGMLLIWACSSNPVVAVVLMVACCCGLFFQSSPQQLLMVKVGEGGGEMIGSACVQVAFNGGNAIGASIGQAVLDAGMTYNWPALAGAPIAAASVALLLLFSRRFEKDYA